MNNDEMNASLCVGIIEDHFDPEDRGSILVANILLALRDALRRGEMPKSLEQMTTREIIDFVDAMFPH